MDRTLLNWRLSLLAPTLMALGLSACGGRSALDASVDAGEPLVGPSCAAILAAEEGARCVEPANRCSEGVSGFCSLRVATCEAGQVRHASDVGLDGDPATLCPEGNSALEANGPAGERFAFERGTGGGVTGFVWSMTLLFASGASDFECAARPRLTVEFVPSASGDGYVGALPVSGTLRLEDGDQPLEGTFTVDAYDQFGSGLLSGALQVAGAGWTVTGRIELTVCPELSSTSI